ncbi:hypothetical protein N5P37_005180 [Trichoderma harzianum]|uniref:Uncharacterized protein n=1 Tax=Trichoderma harzianum CBS 226.95 TaxID=983964 RepID=A0A2T4ACR3_TRIHA|nr:hypothetical protein M431DRAFT_5497 [Trichoderma harzianum CBS 226.95]KAK0762367.1 hypothetical protein N5P37_005180 [Trichoderma harzianum]PKK52062.1 hypothetical protein CI102_2608 [Trichoderma harzianum]PTB54875.1 hypothetical protein M431DRAFT_5497 [Trichoderma harzianum CBS 226.95]
MPKDFISVVQDLEDLLCHHITTSTPADFTEELADVLKTVLNMDRNTHWSIQSFLFDFREEYFRQKLTNEQPGPVRPHNDIWPRLNRSAVEPLSNMPMTHDIGPDLWAFAVRYADQVYNVLRLQAKMPYKPFIEVLTENSFIKGLADADNIVMQDNATDGSSDHIMDRREYDVSLHSRLMFLEDRVMILEKREELLDGQLDRATQAMGALRSTNLDLARKVSEVQQRNHDLRRTYAV